MKYKSTPQEPYSRKIGEFLGEIREGFTGEKEFHWEMQGK